MRRTAWIPCLVAILGGPAAAGDAAGVFEARHEFTIKAKDGARFQRVWLAMPQEAPAQDVLESRVEAPYPHTTAVDSEGNRYLYFEVKDPPAEWTVVHHFRLERRAVASGAEAAKTRPLRPEDLKGKEALLEPDEHVVIDERIETLAGEIVGDERNPVTASRLIYDWVLDNVQYWVKRPKELKASPVGSTDYCLTSRTGNCTDFHSLYVSLSRAAGIPTRLVYGSLFKTPLDGVDKDASYHCWVEFWAPGIGWVPLDVAVADIFVGDTELDDANRDLVTLTTADGYSGADRKKVDYYFGNLDARRVTWSHGRDLMLGPDPQVGPVNAMPKAHVVVDGEPGAYDRKLTYRQVRE